MNSYIENVEIKNYKNGFCFIKDNHSFCFDEEKNFIVESNDSCYLFHGGTTVPNIPQNQFFINEKVISLLTHFHTGVHAFCGVFSIITNIFEKFEKRNEYKICINKNLQKGIKEIIELFFEKDKIIFLENDVLYRFEEVVIVPNSLHSYFENEKLTYKISKFIIDSVLKNSEQIETYKKIAILKTESSSVTSNMGTLDLETSKKICQENGYKLIEPSEVGEINLIKYLQNCEQVLFSWGTTFVKNYPYISEKCKKIDVLIIGAAFSYEYNVVMNREILVNKYKNCVFQYHLNTDLSKLKL
jgi:hypothetical protein